jgi:hypothetical protein
VSSRLRPATAAPDPVVSPPITADELGDDPGGFSSRWARCLSWAALASVLLPLVASAVTAVQDLDGSYYAAGDPASIELKTQDVLRHPVLTGLYSRDGWDHPGPAMFYVLAVPYRLLGAHTWGLHVAALLVNGASIAGIALIARRRGGTPLFLITLVGLALLVQGLGADFGRDPWNPFLPVLPFGLLVFLTWEMASGTVWALPVAAGVSTFCVQTHIGYALLAAPLLLWGTGALVVAWRRSGAPAGSRLARAAAVAGLVLVAMWLPPVVEQFTGEQGNLSAISRYFLDDEGQDHHTLTEGYRLITGQFGWPPQWVSGWPESDFFTSEPRVLDRAATPVLLLLVLAGGAVLWRLRVAGSRQLLVLIALLIALGAFWVARTLGPVFSYRVAWASVVGMIAFLPVGWAIWALVVRRFGPAAARALTGVVLVVLAVLGYQNVISATEEARPSFAQPWSPVLAATAPDVVRSLPPGDGDVILRCDGDEGCIVLAGLFLELEQRGLRPAADHAYGVVSSHAPHRVHDGGPVRAVLHVAYGERFDRLFSDDDAELIAYEGPLPAREAARAARRIGRIDDLHERGEMDDIAFFAERIELGRRLGLTIGVFLVPR